MKSCQSVTLAIHRSGSVCLDVINQTWSPMYDMINIFEVFLPQLLRYPNPTDPLNGEAAALMMRDKDGYEAKVKGERTTCTRVERNGGTKRTTLKISSINRVRGPLCLQRRRRRSRRRQRIGRRDEFGGQLPVRGGRRASGEYGRTVIRRRDQDGEARKTRGWKVAVLKRMCGNNMSGSAD